MKPFLVTTLLLLSNIAIKAQNNSYANLELTYPEKLTYSVMIVKDGDGKVIPPTGKVNKGGKVINTYRIKQGSLKQNYFSIFFGGSQTAINDTLSFRSRGRYLSIELKDSFALRNHSYFKFKNVYNFEELFERYNEFYMNQMRKYDSLFATHSDSLPKRSQYSLQSGFAFLKKNLMNPYSFELFSVFIIANPKSNVQYTDASEFYKKYLKNKTKDAELKAFVENRIERLRVSLDEGNKAPHFSTLSVDNQLISNESLSGKNILLIFWATWCSPCMAEQPYLKQINEQYKKDNLIMISISLDNERDSIKWDQVIKEEKLNWIHLFNAPQIIGMFKVNPIPASFLIDEKGIIIYNTLNRENETPDLMVLKSILLKKFGH